MFGGAFAGVGVSSNFRCFWMPLVYWCVFKFSLCLVFFWCVGVVSSFFSCWMPFWVLLVWCLQAFVVLSAFWCVGVVFEFSSFLVVLVCLQIFVVLDAFGTCIQDKQ